MFTTAASCSQPQLVVALLILASSGGQIDMIRLFDGIMALVLEALLNQEAVILPIHILIQRGNLDCD